MLAREAESPRQERCFNTTHWSVILSARKSNTLIADEALEKLCRVYWLPVYYYIRRKSPSDCDAEDLTQEFFFRLLDKNYLAQVDPSKGRFRSFLLVAVNHFLANEWDRVRAVKRGGRVSFISFETLTVEGAQFTGTDSLTPATVFEQRWAMALLAHVLNQLREEHVDCGKEILFEHLKVFLTGEKLPSTYAALADQLGTTEGALKMAVGRLRHRYAELIRAEIANTVTSPNEIDDELRHLFSVLTL